MKLYNTLTNKKDTFVPIEEGKVKMYVCGPTVYNYFHIGNARPFIIFDVLRRYFEYCGYQVDYIQNFTDVDDKIIKKANEESSSSQEVADRYIAEYFKDADALGVRRASVHPKVSENIESIIDLIKSLEKKGLAYNIDGNVYFSVKKFNGYGKLSKQPLDDLESGARVEICGEKKDPLDFALWKKHRPGEPHWDSPWGPGRPGWHIECSAMSCRYLGETIDIHGGGQDLIFPHHENEIAQSEGAHGKQFANYWIHNGYININNEKMSKSKGNFFTVRDIAKEVDLEVVRLFMLSAHYRSPVNFSRELLMQSKAALERLYNARSNMTYLIENAEEGQGPSDKWIEALGKFREDFKSAMDDDINTAEALAVIFDLVRESNTKLDRNSSKEDLEAALVVFDELTDVLGIVKKEEELLEEDIEKLIQKRQDARKNKDFKLSDEIRDELKEKGIVLEDTREGVKWKKVN
ncbi:cysteine--tRNA ligase [Alkalibacter saccharofermentans]|uniref:Cysteine--tRNA ligase n=1 Tax=Alkalibacter saccharofermentans DSM 14828 TaxID=1120975 RepID=A0A1M4X2K4_9FIRM|nr:cysteine--tRNA ligase [Alkalibacter saccharofermentans]SHE87617.1 cysteinyl-tRNA synthetase [Alkalibacter saccharofermentans DSM 14828]